MIGKELSKITTEDLQNLVENVVLEGKTIEYKAYLPGNLDGDKKEFLADVSSFANASGGDIVFGISEDPDTREPRALEGCKILNIDQEINRLDNIIREGIEPRIPSVNIREVGLVNSRIAIIIRIAKSWLSPHRVVFKGHDKFYSRSSNGKYPMDVGELRVAFTISETMAERIRKFREERISRLYANETPLPFHEGPKIILHILPFISFSPGQRFNIDGISSVTNTRIKPIRSGGYNSRYTVEGFLTFSSMSDNEGKYKPSSYAHLYRNGIIEFVEGSILKYDEKRKIPIVFLEREIVKTTRYSFDSLRIMEVQTPVFVYLTLMGATGYTLSGTGLYYLDSGHPIDRDVLALPEVVFEKYDENIEEALKSTFDLIWNACGYPGSESYNEKGERIDQK